MRLTGDIKGKRMNMMKNNDKLSAILEKNEIGAVIISDPYNLRYYSGFSGVEALFYVSASRQMLITDSRYTLWAERECGKEYVYTASDGGKGIIKEYLAIDNVGCLGLEGAHLPYDRYSELVSCFGIDNVVSVSDMLSGPRMVKEADEIEKIARAEAIGDEAFEYICNILRPGMTELEAAMELEMYMRTHGAGGLSFDVIAASGLNSASPHAVPSDRRLQKGDFLTMDFGCVYEGYCSDMTRTVVIGKASDRQRRIYNIVLEAQLAAIDGMKAGLTGAMVDGIARDIISAAGYGDCFGHGLGHSVGLFIHEEPRLSVREGRILEPGMVITVEPGIYVPGFGGVRIEDVVVVEEDGVRNLTHSPKELIEL